MMAVGRLSLYVGFIYKYLNVCSFIAQQLREVEMLTYLTYS